MLQIRLTLLVTLLGVFPSVAILAQTGSTPAATTSANADDRVLNAPYSAQRRFTSVEKLADGTTSRSESGGSEARDSQGRTYSAGERHWTYLEGKRSVLKSEMLYRIHDSVANTDTRWDSSSKEVKVVHWPQNTPEGDASKAQCQAACLEDTMGALGAIVEKLGVKTFEGVVAEGTRSSYTVPAGQDHNDLPIVVVHENWYCPALKFVILETNDDPRSGRIRNELVDIVRGDPDVTQYQPPADYVVQDFQMP
jgi:hypothetical protein